MRGLGQNRKHIEASLQNATVDALFARYAAERGRDERFGDFLVRAGIVAAKPGIPLEVRT